MYVQIKAEKLWRQDYLSVFLLKECSEITAEFYKQ